MESEALWGTLSVLEGNFCSILGSTEWIRIYFFVAWDGLTCDGIWGWYQESRLLQNAPQYWCLTNQESWISFLGRRVNLFHKWWKRINYGNFEVEKQQFLGEAPFFSSASKILDLWTWCMPIHLGRCWFEYTIILHFQLNWRWWVDNLSQGGCDRDDLNDDGQFTIFFLPFSGIISASIIQEFSGMTVQKI